MRNIVKSYKREMRIENFKVDGTGTASLGEGQYRGTLVDNGTGDYTITFAEPFGRVPTAVVGVMTADTIHQISAISKTAITVKTYAANDGTTAQDADFCVHVMGAEVADEQ